MVNGDVAELEVTSGIEIQPAIDHLQSYLPTDPNANFGLVTVTSSTTFLDTIVLKDSISLALPESVTLTFDAAETVHRALDLSNTQNSGVIGGGTLDVNEKATFGIYGHALTNAVVGNVGGLLSAPLKVIGWRNGVGLYSTAAVAASNLEVRNLFLIEPASSNVSLPLVISNRPTTNGLVVTNVSISDVTVDGADSSGVGGEWSAGNQYTADQITLQGVHGGTVDNVISTNGGENGFAITIGSRDIVVTDAIA